MGQCLTKPERKKSSNTAVNPTPTDTQDPVQRFKGSAERNASASSREPSKHIGFVDSLQGRAVSLASSMSEALAVEALGTALDAVMRDASQTGGHGKPSPRVPSASAQGGVTARDARAPKHHTQQRGRESFHPPGATESFHIGQGGTTNVTANATPTPTTTPTTSPFEAPFSNPATSPQPANKRPPVRRPKSRLNIASVPGPDPEIDTPQSQDPGGAVSPPPQPPTPPSPSPPLPSSSECITPVTPGPPEPVHEVPAARGGPSEPGLWVVRRTGEVRQRYRLSEALGKGQFGQVIMATDLVDGSRWACKSVSKRRVQGMHDFSMSDVLREVEVLYLVGGHPSVVGLREVYEDDEDLHLIMELCQGGDWFERLITYGRYTEAEAAAVVRSVLEALAYCHSLGVMHRDIKPENIMFTDRTEAAQVKLTDFGLAALFQEGEVLSEVLGSAYYVAPEVLREKYNKEADIWSTGVVLFIALGGYAPFDGSNEREVFKKILYEPLQFSDPSWDDISEGAKEVIARMLTKDPKQRATIKDLLAHPWLATCAGTITPSAAPTPFMGMSPVASVSAPKSQGLNASILLNNQMAKGKLAKGSIAAVVAAAVARGADVKTVPDAVVARLQQFAGMNAFKRQARRLLAAYLPEEEVVGLANIFRAMDTDGDGVLTQRELREALLQRGVHTTDKAAQKLLERTDLDGDGAIDYEDFLAATLHLARLERDDRLWRAFRHFDTTGCGFISREALVEGLQALQPGTKIHVDRILAEVDHDGDGRICYGEFCDMLRNQPEPDLFYGEGSDGPGWGAWGEQTESGRLLLALPPDSRATTRPPSLAGSRNTSSNDRHLNTGRSLGRSLGGMSLYAESRFAPTRSSRPSNAGTKSIGAKSIASQGTDSDATRSFGSHRSRDSGYSRFGSMRRNALIATSIGTNRNDDNLQRAVRAHAAAAAALAAVNREQELAREIAGFRGGRGSSDGDARSSGKSGPSAHTDCSSVPVSPLPTHEMRVQFRMPDEPVNTARDRKPSAAWPDKADREMRTLMSTHEALEEVDEDSALEFDTTTPRSQPQVYFEKTKTSYAGTGAAATTSKAVPRVSGGQVTLDVIRPHPPPTTAPATLGHATLASADVAATVAPQRPTHANTVACSADYASEKTWSTFSEGAVAASMDQPRRSPLAARRVHVAATTPTQDLQERVSGASDDQARPPAQPPAAVCPQPPAQHAVAQIATGDARGTRSSV